MTQEPVVSKDQGATVGYKAWLPASGGGSETIEIVLPLGAPPESLAQAIEQWRTMRVAALEALRTVQGPSPAPVDVVLTFGKYNGRTLAQVRDMDRDYLWWLAQNAREASVRQAAQALLDDGIPPASRPAPAPAGAAADDEQLPF